MTQKTGALIFDETADRYDIRFDLNYPKRRAEIITAQNKGCMIRAPCVSKPQHIFFYN